MRWKISGLEFREKCSDSVFETQAYNGAHLQGGGGGGVGGMLTQTSTETGLNLSISSS